MRVYVIRPIPAYKQLFTKMCRGFGFEYKEIQNIGQVAERENIIVFHPKDHNDPDWVKTESLVDFEHPENAVYVFGADINGDIIQEIEEWSGDIKDKIRFVRIPLKEGTNTGALWSVSACAIALYERFTKGNK